MRSDFAQEPRVVPLGRSRRGQYHGHFLSPCAVRDAVFAIEALILAASHLVVHALYFDLILAADPVFAWYGGFAAVNALVYFIARRVGASPQARELGSFGSAFIGSVRALLAAATFFLVIGFLGKFGEIVSRGWFLSAFLVGGASIAVFDLAVIRLVGYVRSRADNPFVRRVAVVGDAAPGRIVRRMLERYHGSDVMLLGPFDANRSRTFGRAEQRFDALDDMLERGAVDEVVLAFETTDEPLLLHLVEKLASHPVTVSLYPCNIQRRLGRLAIFAGGGLPLVTLIRQPSDHWGMLGKVAIDRLGSALGIVFLAPLLLSIAIAIKLDSPGPVLFKQKRHGFGHRLFDVYKFRTMRNGSDQPGELFRQASRDDPRITRVGAFLRRTSMDELPPLFNVLKGEMSLVGPRPHPLPLNVRFGDQLPFYAARHRVLPGITGLAQINGLRGETDTPEKMAARLECDLDYIRRWSLWLDIKIIVATLLFGFVHKNAF